MTTPKQKKPSLREEFENSFPLLEFKNEIWEFFQPHIKTTKAKIIFEIPAEKIKEFNELWPKGKLPTGQYGKCNEKELTNAFQAFFKAFPTFTNWDIIIQCAKIYLQERENEKWEFTRRSKYFVRRENKDKSVDFLIGDYYTRIDQGEQDTPEEENKGFEPRVL